MTDQEVCDFLATVLMGWNYPNEGDFHWWGIDHEPIFDPYYDSPLVPRGIKELPNEESMFFWPTENATHCLMCVKKIGELGLGGKYALRVCEMIDKWPVEDTGFDNYEIDYEATYFIMTAPLETCCDVMVEVLKEAKAGKEKYETHMLKKGVESGGL